MCGGERRRGSVAAPWAAAPSGRALEGAFACCRSRAREGGGAPPPQLLPACLPAGSSSKPLLRPPLPSQAPPTLPRRRALWRCLHPHGQHSVRLLSRGRGEEEVNAWMAASHEAGSSAGLGRRLASAAALTSAPARWRSRMCSATGCVPKASYQSAGASHCGGSLLPPAPGAAALPVGTRALERIPLLSHPPSPPAATQPAQTSTALACMPFFPPLSLLLCTLSAAAAAAAAGAAPAARGIAACCPQQPAPGAAAAAGSTPLSPAVPHIRPPPTTPRRALLPSHATPTQNAQTAPFLSLSLRHAYP